MASATSAGAQEGFSNEGAKSCIDCHGNARVMGIVKTVHAKAENPDTPAAQKECQSCHGPSATHMRFPMQVENLHFGAKSKTAPEVQNRVCLSCHESGARQEWKASAHGFEKVLCSNCHSIHDPTRIVPAAVTVSNKCSSAGCHATLMDDADATTFTHAVGKPLGSKGHLTCAGCHNPHGPLSAERCLDCHLQTAEALAKESEKARRFHDVARERGTGCMRCHQALSHPIKPLELEQQGL